jgi:glutathione S-transferase
MFKDRITTLPDAAGASRVAQEKITWLDGLMAGKEFVCGKRITLAGHPALQLPELRRSGWPTPNANNKNIKAWYEGWQRAQRQSLKQV